MITVNLGNREAYKLYKSLKDTKRPVLKGFRDKLEIKIFDLLAEHLDELNEET